MASSPHSAKRSPRCLIADIEENGDAVDPELGETESQPEVGTVDEALSSAEVAKVDPAGLTPEDIRSLLGSAATCEFGRTNEGDPSLVMAGNAGGDQTLGHLDRIAIR